MSEQDAKLIFVQSWLGATLPREDLLTEPGLTIFDFLEAIARLADMIDLPKKDELPLAYKMEPIVKDSDPGFHMVDFVLQVRRCSVVLDPLPLLCPVAVILIPPCPRARARRDSVASFTTRVPGRKGAPLIPLTGQDSGIWRLSEHFFPGQQRLASNKESRCLGGRGSFPTMRLRLH